MADVSCAPNLEKQSEIGRYRAASGDVGRYRAVLGEFGRGDVSWAGGCLEISKENGSKEEPSWGPRQTDKGANRYPQINVYIMGEGTFPGQGGASKNRWSMVHKRDLGSGAPRKIEGQWPTRGTLLGTTRKSRGALRNTLKSMSMLWAMECDSWAMGRLE